MAGNSGTTFAKRQKERARQERQAEKAQRRAQRKLQQKEEEGDTIASQPSRSPIVTYDDEGNPEGLSFHDFQFPTGISACFGVVFKNQASCPRLR
jgi:hypothetical protein